ncbi:hypothetical protein VTO73DRAFT_9776 [Trametes versicolor]
MAVSCPTVFEHNFRLRKARYIRSETVVPEIYQVLHNPATRAGPTSHKERLTSDVRRSQLEDRPSSSIGS